MTERTARLDELLREEISAVIARDIDDPRVGFVTVTDVEVAPDLRHAKVWVSVIGSEQERKETLRALGRAMPFVRQRLGKLRLKRIPELHLKLETTRRARHAPTAHLRRPRERARAGRRRAARDVAHARCPLRPTPSEDRRMTADGLTSLTAADVRQRAGRGRRAHPRCPRRALRVPREPRMPTRSARRWPWRWRWRSWADGRRRCAATRCR